MSQSLLRNEALSVTALEELPTELFPPLFTAAFAGRHNEILKAMVQAWPFPCLPLGALMKEHQPRLETFQAALDGLDVLLAQEIRSRCLKMPLETLSITNCLISESDLMHLSRCLSISQLKDLGLNGVNLTSMSSRPLQVLIERASATLQDLDLDECGIMDSQFSALLPALRCCSQLTTFSFCGNPISMAVLESLLHHMVGLSKLSHVLYPAPLESYEDVRGTLHLGCLAQLHTWLKQMLQESGRPGMVWFSANPCPHCGDWTFYDPEPILCPCYMPV
uniref:Uncharacterized protein n=1 Tax=Sus scrofa TaxID=9823 RepID=A0A8D1EG33_PIG